MSSKLKLTGLGGGDTIIQGNDVIATDQTFTLPDTGGEIHVSGNNISATAGTFSGDVSVDGNILQGTNQQIIWNQTTETGVTSLPVGVVQISRTADTTLFCNQIGTPIGPIASFLNDGVPTATISNDAVRIGGTIPSSPNITLNATGIIEAFPNSSDRNTNLRLITSGSDSQARLQLNGNGSVNYTAIGLGGGSDKFRVRGDGQIFATSTTIAQISSERRLKENISPVDATTAWETIKTVPYYAYSFIGSTVTTYGPMADEVPDEMRIATDRTDDVGVIHTYDNGMLQARLYVALQTALTRIEALEAEVQSLKGGTP